MTDDLFKIRSTQVCENAEQNKVQRKIAIYLFCWERKEQVIAKKLSNDLLTFSQGRKHDGLFQEKIRFIKTVVLINAHN